MGRITLRLVLVALAAIAGLSMVPVLVRSTSASIETIGVARLGIALLVLTPWVLWRGGLRKLTGRDWLGLVVVGLVFGSHWWTYFYAIKTAGAATAAIALATFGIHLLVLNWVVNRQPVRSIDGLSLLLCLAGCVLVSPAGVGSGALGGFLVGLLSAFLYGSLPLLHRRIIHLPTLVRTWGQFVFALMIFLSLWPQTDWQLQRLDWVLLSILGVVCTLIAHGLWVKATSELPGFFIGSFYYLHIPFALIQATVILGEPVTLTMLVGALLIIVANILLHVYPWWQQRKRALVT